MTAYSKQQGFTLIELMISVLLGLIIVAAVTQLYVMAVRTASTQRAAAGILDTNIYGLQQIESKLRMAGLGLGDASKLNYLCGGILITSTASISTNCDGSNIATGEDPTTNKLKTLTPLMTRANVTPTNTIGGQAPQLTIQYRAPVDMIDCEGRLALGARQAIIKNADGTIKTDRNGNKIASDIEGQVVIERYFIKNNNGELELRCDAGRYLIEEVESEPNVSTPQQTAAVITGNQPVQNFGDDGVLVISGIDDFDVRLGVQTPSGLQYTPINDYTRNTSNPMNIVSLKIAVLAKGQVATNEIDTTTTPQYTIFNRQVSIKSGISNKFIRRVYETNTMLRNSRGTL